MTYRSTQPSARGSVTHGPFPLRLGGFCGSLMAIAMGVLIGVMAFDDARLICDRPSNSCSYHRSQFSDSSTRFPLTSLTAVRVTIYTGSKDNKRGRPTLQLKTRELPLKGVSLAEASRFERELNQALESGADHFEIALLSDRLMALVALIFMIGGGGLLVSSVRGIGRIRYELQAGVLHATHSIFGIPTQRWTIDVHDAEGVEVDWSHIKEFWHRKHMPGSCAGRLIVHCRDGHERHLSEQTYRGYHIHLRAQEQLYAMLELPPRSANTLARQRTAAEAAAPPPPFGGGWGAVLALSWAGACCGALVGIAVLGAVGVAVGLFKINDNIPEWVAIGGSLGGAAGGVLVAQWVRRRAMAQ